MITGQFNTVPVITITGTPADSTTTIYAGLDRGGIINVTTGDLGLLGANATLNLNQGGPSSIVNINDQNSTNTSAIYEVAATQVRRIVGGFTVPINYSGVATMTLNAGTKDDSVRVKSVPAGMALTVNAGSGNDLVTLGDGNVVGAATPRPWIVQETAPAADGSDEPSPSPSATS